MASTYTVTRSETMRASPEAIFDYVANFRNWPAWSPWEELDPEMEKTYTGDDGTVGSGYSWSGNRKAGAGSMKLTDIQAPTQMTSDLEFLKPFKSSNTMGFTLSPSGDNTTVTWTMNATHSLMTRVMGFFGLMDRMIGKDFDKGLTKLKGLVEA